MELSVGLAQQSSFSISLGHGPQNDPRWIDTKRENIREQLIRHNFTSLLPNVWSLGKTSCVQDLRSQWQILQSTMRNTSLGEWMITALIVGLVVGGIVAIPIGVRYQTIFLNNRYTQMTLGTLHWFDRYGWRIRPYNKIDFFIELIENVFVVVGVSLFLLGSAFIVFCERSSFFSVYDKESQPYRFVQQIDLTDSSMKGFLLERLANKKEESGWTDPISYETLFEEKVLSPSVFRVNQYAIGLLPFLGYVFQRDFKLGKVSHFAQQSDMDADTEKKFVRDVTRFFSITEENFFKCSKVPLWFGNEEDAGPVLINEGGLVERDGPLNEGSLNWFRLARKVAFLKLLPPKIVNEYFRDFLLEPEKQIARELIRNPKMLNYKAIFEGARFNKELLVRRS